MLPLVSILVPAYNAERWIGATLRSALEQAWPRTEIIVVDDGSRDGTLAIARSFESGTVRVVTQENQGAAAARNRAFSLSQGDYIQWLDADDLLAPDKVSLQCARLRQQGTKRTLVSGAWGEFLRRPERTHFLPTALWAPELSPEEWLVHKLGEGVFIQTCAWLVSRELTEAAGPWDVRLAGDDDGEYFCRVVLQSDRVLCVPEARVFYRSVGAAGLHYVGHSDRMMESYLLSTELHVKYALALADNERMRAACVRFLQTRSADYYPERPDLMRRASELATALGGQLETPTFPAKYAWLARIGGPALAKDVMLQARRTKWWVRSALEAITVPRLRRGPSDLPHQPPSPTVEIGSAGDGDARVVPQTGPIGADWKAERFRKLTGMGEVAGSIGAQSVRGGTIAISAQLVDFALRFSSIAILARLIVPEHFGLFAMVTAFTTVVERLKDLGLFVATVQRDRVSHELISTLFWINLGFGLLLTGVVSCAAWPIAAFFGDPRLFHVTLVISTSFLLSGVGIQHAALLRRSMEFGRLGAIQIGASVLSQMVGILMALEGYGYWALVVREVLRRVITAFGAVICFPWVPGAPSMWRGVGSMLRFGGHLTGFNIVNYIGSVMGQIIVGKLFGAHDLGLYRQGAQLVNAPLEQVTIPTTAVGEAALSRLQNDRVRYRRFYQRFLSLVCLTMPIVGFLFVFSEEVVRSLLGVRWRDATPVFAIMAVAALLSPALATTGTVAVTCGHPRRLFWIGVLEPLALMVFFLAGAPWGLLGVASAHVWVPLLIAAPWVYWSTRGTPVDWKFFCSTAVRPLVSTLVMVAVLVPFRWAASDWPAFATLGVGALLGAATFVAVWLALPGGRALGAELIHVLGWRAAGRAEDVDIAVAEAEVDTGRHGAPMTGGASWPFGR